MDILVILAHPGQDSFNHAIAESIVAVLRDSGHRVMFHDLYRERFDPVLTSSEISRKCELDTVLKIHCGDLADADGIIIIHPNWWGQPPAILKGWIDRVIRPGVAYEFNEGDKGEGVPAGLLKAKAAVVFNTSNTPAGREQEVFGDPLETIWKNCIFGLCGVREFHRKMFGVIVSSTDEQRKRWLQEAGGIVKQIFPS